MTTFLATLAIVLLTVTGMALGVMFQGKRLRGSCGLTGDDCTCTALRARLCRHAQAPVADDGA